MRIPLSLQVSLMAVGLTAFYMMVGQAVPQKEVHPPEVIELDKDMSTAEMVEIGKEIFDGKGICLTCHNGSGRFPDLEGIAQRAGAEVPGLSALDYLAQTLYEPDIYIVPGFNPGMPAVNKPPIGLTDDEILAVIAYLQTLGGEATVTMETKTAYNGGEAGGGAEVAEAPPAGGADGAPASPLASFGCTSCHLETLDPAANLDGPSLADVGNRLDRDQLLLATMNHDGQVGLDAASLSEVQSLVAHMSTLKGAG